MLAVRADDAAADLDALVGRFVAATAARTSMGRRGLRPLRDVIQEYFERIEQAASQGPGAPTGLTALNEMIGGLQPQKFILLAARPGMGKTALAEGMAVASASAGHRTLFFSQEMPAWEVVGRRLAGNAGVDSRRPLAGTLAEGELTALCRAATELASYPANRQFDRPLFFEDSGQNTFLDIAHQARLARMAGPIGLIVVDYLQLLKATDPTMPREQQIGEMSRGLKQLSRVLDVPILALSQLNRDCEKRPDKRPRCSDLRESGSLEQDADIVLLLHREWDEDKGCPSNDAELIIGKHRGGPLGTVPLRFVPSRTRFEDAGMEVSWSGDAPSNATN